MRRLAIVAIVLMSCGGPPVPVNTMLWRFDEPWTDLGRGGIQTSRGTIVIFRASKEYVELHAALIERPDETVYIQPGPPRIAIVGTWKKRGRDIVATRQRVARSGQQISPEPFCAEPALTFRVEPSGTAVRGNAGGEGEGRYDTVTRLVSVDFESYVDSAKRSSVTCAPK